jgi:hypothetical protein
MSDTIAPPCVNFEQDVVQMVQRLKKALKFTKDDPQFMSELMETTPGFVARLACDTHEVVVRVRKGNDLWSPALERAVRDEVATHKSPNMAPVRLKVERY